ncbi:MAG: hypothetical protein A3E81_05315 [Gammaproteobacteria bacterium RIFCSPHIGHO2_12_FULL_36_30]|nr:MAG: hypothetical protein A3E81_05315 [Gammaproteobacteria bacterium RIFCSPHIGHO2_12_FULL_36_30]
MQDLHIRQRALDPQKSFIVQAPAGSGKTEILTQRYLVLLSHAQKAPEEIIAITFTRKAAAEMRARIIHALEFSNENEPDQSDYRHITWKLAKNVLKKDKELKWDLLQNPNRLRILTIDALSAFLCRQTPMLTNFGGTPAICENADEFYQLAAQRVLTDSNNNLDHLLLHLDNNVENVQKLLADLLAHRDQWLPHILFCYKNQSELRTLLENNLKNIVEEKLHSAAKNMPEHLKQLLVLLARHAGHYFQENNPEHVLAACADFSFELNPPCEKFYSWFGLANLLLTQKNEWRKTIDIKSGFGPKDENKTLLLSVLTELVEHEAFKESLCDIISLPPITYTDLQWKTLNSLNQILPLLAAQLTLVFQEKNQIDFIELNLAALKALGNEDTPTDLALYLDFQIRHLLIDEFQDTSVTHLHLLEKIIVGWEKNDGRTLFVVGDPMQSIYRFRNAEVGLFLRAQQHGIGSVELESLTLTMNFRSQYNLVEWFNNTFQIIFPTVSDIATGRVPYTKAIAAKSAIENNNVHFYPIISDDENDEAKLLIEKIKMLREKNYDETIAILVRSRAQLIPIIYCLQEEKLSFRAIDIEPLANRPEIRDLLSLTRALLHRADRIAWLAILRAPFCGLKLNDLAIIAEAFSEKIIYEAIHNVENISALSQDGKNRVTYLKNILEKTFSEQYQLSFPLWIEKSWLNLQGPACLSSETELNYTRAYFDLLEKMDQESSVISTEYLIEQCEKLFANSDNTESTTIQIMTIHKSKGLEFDHVFIPGLQRQTPHDNQKLIRWLDRPNELGGNDLLLAPIKSAETQSDSIYDYLKLIENQKQDAEITRLLYVAATRAKKSLHLFASVGVGVGVNTFLGKLSPLYKDILATHAAKKNEAEKKMVEKKSPLFLRLINQNNILSEKKFAEEKPVKIDIRLHSQQSRIIGTAIHNVFQTISETGTKSSISQSHLISLGLLQHEIPDAMEKINIAIQNILSDERGQWILLNAHHDAHSEWALTFKNENEIQHVIIDRAFIDKKNNTRWIIDYKTSMPKENESQNDFLKREKENYETQLNHYANIISQTQSNPIKLGLYFPMCCGWVEWDYSETLIPASVSI